MEWNAVMEFINPELMVVVVACWIIGYCLYKRRKYRTGVLCILLRWSPSYLLY
ncbi:hypothetical protein D3C76_566380 [compost metagenome]